jgi:hypothetical protein
MGEGVLSAIRAGRDAGKAALAKGHSYHPSHACEAAARLGWAGSDAELDAFAQGYRAAYEADALRLARAWP